MERTTTDNGPAGKHILSKSNYSSHSDSDSLPWSRKSLPRVPVSPDSRVEEPPKHKEYESPIESWGHSPIASSGMGPRIPTSESASQDVSTMQQVASLDSFQSKEARTLLTKPTRRQTFAQRKAGAAKWTEKFWVWEISACCFSLACMIAIISVLVYEDGKPLDQWSFRVTPSAVLSFIITLSKSSFLLVVAETISQLKWLHFDGQPQKVRDLQTFDEASRGPLGSLGFLAAGPGKSFLGLCAAAITILALFIDPFVQLVFSFPSQRVIMPDSEASFQVTTMYDPHHYRGNDTILSGPSVGTEMQGAIAGGLYARNNPSILSCATGNCTFEEQTTLGVCAGCHNITETVKSNCSMQSEGDYACHYVLGEKTEVDARFRLWHGEGDEFSQESMIQTRWNSTSVDSQTSTDSNLPADDGRRLVRMAVFRAIQPTQRSSDADDPEVFLSAAKAFECMFLLCVKTYPAFNVTNGQVKLPEPDEDLLLFDEFGDLKSGAYEPVYNTMRRSSSVKGKNPDTTAYKINAVDYHALADYLAQMFATGWYENGMTTRYPRRGENALYNPTVATSQGSPYLITAIEAGREFANSRNLSDTIRAMAESMTETIRVNGNSTKQPGRAYAHKTVIEIRWGWMAYPIVLMLVSTALLAIMIWKARAAGNRYWKNSSLALLVHQLEGWELPEEGVGGRKELKDVMGDVRVRLCDGGWSGARPVFVKED